MINKIGQLDLYVIDRIRNPQPVLVTDWPDTLNRTRTRATAIATEHGQDLYRWTAKASDDVSHPVVAVRLR